MVYMLSKTDLWLTDSVPPESYKIQLAYVDTTEKKRPRKYSAQDTYRYRDLGWVDTPHRFTNYAQANLFALEKLPPNLYRLVGSNDKPNYFAHKSYQTIRPPKMTADTKKYLEMMRDLDRVIAP